MSVQPRFTRVFGAVNIGSFRVSAMIAGLTEDGEMLVLGSGHRASQGIKRGYVTDMASATYAVRDALERAEKMHPGVQVASVWLGCTGAGMTSHIISVEIEIGGRRVEDEDIDQLLIAANDQLDPEGRTVLHAQPAYYYIDSATGIANPVGLHAERLGVDVHVMLADTAPVRNLMEAVQNAHLKVEAVVASPVAAGYACLSEEERDLGVALIELGAEVTNVAVYSAGVLVGMQSIPHGMGDTTDAVASAFGIRRFQAERLKCVHGSAIASPADHKEMIPVVAPGDEAAAAVARGADDNNRVPRAELISVITGDLDTLISAVGRSLVSMGFSGKHGRQVVLTGGGAELTGLADYAQSALGTPVRIGRPLHLQGLPEAHSVPGFSTLAGIVLYAADDPVDIRKVRAGKSLPLSGAGSAMIQRVWTAMKEYF